MQICLHMWFNHFITIFCEFRYKIATYVQIMCSFVISENIHTTGFFYLAFTLNSLKKLGFWYPSQGILWWLCQNDLLIKGHHILITFAVGKICQKSTVTVHNINIYQKGVKTTWKDCKKKKTSVSGDLFISNPWHMSFHVNCDGCVLNPDCTQG